MGGGLSVHLLIGDYQITLYITLCCCPENPSPFPH